MPLGAGEGSFLKLELRGASNRESVYAYRTIPELGVSAIFITSTRGFFLPRNDSLERLSAESDPTCSRRCDSSISAEFIDRDKEINISQKGNKFLAMDSSNLCLGMVRAAISDIYGFKEILEQSGVLRAALR